MPNTLVNINNIANTNANTNATTANNNNIYTLQLQSQNNSLGSSRYHSPSPNNHTIQDSQQYKQKVVATVRGSQMSPQQRLVKLTKSKERKLQRLEIKEKQQQEQDQQQQLLMIQEQQQKQEPQLNQQEKVKHDQKQQLQVQKITQSRVQTTSGNEVTKSNQDLKNMLAVQNNKEYNRGSNSNNVVKQIKGDHISFPKIKRHSQHTDQQSDIYSMSQPMIEDTIISKQDELKIKTMNSYIEEITGTPNFNLLNQESQFSYQHPPSHHYQQLTQNTSMQQHQPLSLNRGNTQQILPPPTSQSQMTSAPNDCFDKKRHNKNIISTNDHDGDLADQNNIIMMTAMSRQGQGVQSELSKIKVQTFESLNEQEQQQEEQSQQQQKQLMKKGKKQQQQQQNSQNKQMQQNYKQSEENEEEDDDDEDEEEQLQKQQFLQINGNTQIDIQNQIATQSSLWKSNIGLDQNSTQNQSTVRNSQEKLKNQPQSQPPSQQLQSEDQVVDKIYEAIFLKHDLLGAKKGLPYKKFKHHTLNELSYEEKSPQFISDDSFLLRQQQQQAHLQSNSQNNSNRNSNTRVDIINDGTEGIQNHSKIDMRQQKYLNYVQK